MSFDGPDGGPVVMGSDALDQAAFFERAEKAESGGLVDVGTGDQFLEAKGFAFELKGVEEVACAEDGVDKVLLAIGFAFVQLAAFNG